MKHAPILIAAAAIVVLGRPACGQGTFQNMNFEFANVPAVPSGQSGGYVASSNGLPGWTVYYGLAEAAQILHNDLSVGSVSVSILGPVWDTNSGVSTIQGNYSAVVQAGFNGVGIVPAAIGQTGVVPATAMSIQFKAETVSGGSAGQIGVWISGQDVPLVPLMTASGYTLYGGDVSSFAGGAVDLRIVANPTASYSFSSFVIDSIVFSPQSVPEPSPSALLALAAFCFGLWRRVLRK